MKFTTCHRLDLLRLNNVLRVFQHVCLVKSHMDPFWLQELSASNMDLEEGIGFGKKENEEETEVGGARVLEHCETHVMEEQKETEVESVGDKEMERETEGVEMENETDWDNWYDPWDEWLHSSHGSAYWLGKGKAATPSRFASKSFDAVQKAKKEKAVPKGQPTQLPMGFGRGKKRHTPPSSLAVLSHMCLTALAFLSLYHS